MLTFGMIAFLWLLLTIIPVVIFYFLRMRFREQPISSTYIWNKFKEMLSTGNKLKWRTVLLLILQILALIFLILALMKPSLLTGMSSKPAVCYLLDVSASMGTTDVSEGGKDSRLDAVKKNLSDELAKLSDDADIMIFLCSSYAKPLSGIGNNKAKFIEKLKSVTVTDDAFRESEVSNAIMAWRSKQKRKMNFVIFTDGGLDFQGRVITDVLGSSVRTVYTGTGGGNIGVSGLRFVTATSGSSYQAQFYARNSFEVIKHAVITIKSGDDAISQTELDLPPGLSKHIIDMSGELVNGAYTLEISGNKDDLLIDDRCYLSVNPKPQIKILVVGKENPFINAALSYSNILYSTSDKLPQSGNSDNWDIIIANYIKIPGEVKNNMLSFGEVPENSPLKYDRVTSGVLVKYESNHPLLRYVDWENTRVVRSLSLSLNTGINALATVNGLPVMAAWERGGYKYAVCTIDIFNSDIGLSGSFPIFLQNFISWCVPQNDSQLKYTFDAGDTAVRYETSTWKMTGKKKMEYRYMGNRITMTPLLAGIYEWENLGYKGTISVNVPIGESDIMPKKLIGKTTGFITTDSVSSEKINLEKLPILIFILLLIAEWLLWIGLPFKRKGV